MFIFLCRLSEKKEDLKKFVNLNDSAIKNMELSQYLDILCLTYQIVEYPTYA